MIPFLYPSFLEVLIHDVDHAVAECPEEEEGADERERERQILPVFGDEETGLLGGRGGHDDPRFYQG